jgi:hypothetical protein
MQVPDVALIKDEEVKKCLQDLNTLIIDITRNVLDDISRLLPQAVDTLPAASADFYQRFLIKNNAGALDTLHICLYNAATSTYVWKQITVS